MNVEKRAKEICSELVDYLNDGLSVYVLLKPNGEWDIAYSYSEDDDVSDVKKVAAELEEGAESKGFSKGDCIIFYQLLELFGMKSYAIIVVENNGNSNFNFSIN